MTSFNQVLAYILTDATSEQLNELAYAAKERRSFLSRKAKFAFTVGQNVKFSHKGREYSCTIKNIKVKKADVICNQTRVGYSVPLNMLEAA